jgi:hypothetical protein
MRECVTRDCACIGAREESKDETDVPESAENDMEIDEIAEEVGDVREDFDPAFLEDFSGENFEEDPNNDGSGDGNDDSDEKFENSVMGIYLTAIRDQLQAELSRIKKSTTPEWLQSAGLNEMLWAPWFPLPAVESLLRSVEPGTWMGDNDVGEMFLNFASHESVQALCGVDLTKYFPDKVPEVTLVLWERWTRCAMGLSPSPYFFIVETS